MANTHRAEQPTSAQRTAQARADALALIADSHDLPYLDAVGRLAVWLHEDPARLTFLAWQLAVWHDPNQPVSWLDAAVVALPCGEAAA